MCAPKRPKPPPVVIRDPVADAAAAANEASALSNRELATRRKRLRASSLFTNGARGVRGPVRESALSQAVPQSA